MIRHLSLFPFCHGSQLVKSRMLGIPTLVLWVLCQTEERKKIQITSQAFISSLIFLLIGIFCDDITGLIGESSSIAMLFGGMWLRVGVVQPGVGDMPVGVGVVLGDGDGLMATLSKGSTITLVIAELCKGEGWE